ncbi:hypothetical protein EV702DRAFT_1285026 [Suillus placidus]|uniref:Uncharacterized protein n=1 Tax=Suillus placidus TaxID=48579 RepID=A0A9P7CUJ4_9AGAM|nr:hypothetical protein EV702DRAFT_1285026 [Suillus placidus]
MSHTEGLALSPALVEAILAASAAPNSASTAHLTVLASGNNPCFWDPKIRSEQWYDTQGDPFTIQFPVMIEPMGKHSHLDPYFLLPTLKQPELKDVRTVKAQFQLCALDNDYPLEVVLVRCAPYPSIALNFRGCYAKSDEVRTSEYMKVRWTFLTWGGEEDKGYYGQSPE